MNGATSEMLVPVFAGHGVGLFYITTPLLVDGCIISTTSLAARNGGGSKSTLYAASKAFVSNFTRGLAKEVARHGIRVNAIAPGVIGKPNQAKTQPAHQLEASIKLTPMRRIGTVDECVGAYLFLASSEMAGFITGQIIEVNGGLQMP